MYRTAVAAAEQDTDVDHVGLIGTVLSLANVLDRADRAEEAEATYLRAITLAEPTASADERDRQALGVALFTLGRMYKERGRTDDAIDRLEQARGTVATTDVEGGAHFVELIDGELAALRGDDA